MLATDFGIQHGSCDDAMVWRRSLGPTATQADAYLACQRGSRLLWQLGKLPPEQYESLRPAVQRALDRIVKRAIQRVLAEIEGIEEPWAEKWRLWAERWLSGEDRSWAAAWVARSSRSSRWAWSASWAAAESARAANAARSSNAARWAADSAWSAEAAAGVEAVSEAAARASESQLQADDIRAEIPTWPGE